MGHRAYDGLQVAGSIGKPTIKKKMSDRLCQLTMDLLFMYLKITLQLGCGSADHLTMTGMTMNEPDFQRA